MREALMVFRQFKSKGIDLNVVSCTSVITSCSQNGKDMEAFGPIQRDAYCWGKAKFNKNLLYFTSLWKHCSMHGKATHSFSIRSRISGYVYVGSALVDMYTKCGRMEMSCPFFDELNVRAILTFEPNYMMFHGKLHGDHLVDLLCHHVQQWSQAENGIGHGQEFYFIGCVCLWSLRIFEMLEAKIVPGIFGFSGFLEDSNDFLGFMDEFARATTLADKAGSSQRVLFFGFRKDSGLDLQWVSGLKERISAIYDRVVSMERTFGFDHQMMAVVLSLDVSN
ncbi:hypothetical protein RHSIM_Rhsim06G0228100 [Rhododendron simsii]|uniref:Uncharacterized protein n=1 Tax=Rhododendron simsii TaxID=118357 RepID=A0A834GX95_RHOSS|nr:hypothetical protein RHSIM_Rhsim06G0228100 [Rhododendron simsii]